MARKDDLVMRNIFLTLLLMISLISFAQTDDLDYHENVDKICNYVKLLHDSPERYEEVTEMMKNDFSWAMMTEFYDNCTNKENICSIFDDVEITGINDRAYQVEIGRGDIPESSDNFCTGTDYRSNYFFYECSVISNSKILTTLNGRTGRQMFVVIPFNLQSIDVQMSLNGNIIDSMTNSQGHICFVIDEEVGENDIIEIHVTNSSDNNQSFVIINHNSVI